MEKDKLKKFDKQLKINIIGDYDSGKTYSIRSYLHSKFGSPPSPLVNQIDFTYKQLNDKTYQVFIWDTFNQEKYDSIPNFYFQDSKGIILMYSIASKKSFQHIRKWVNKAEEQCDRNVPKILIGSKCDLSLQRQVTQKEGEELASELNCQFFECSSKKRINIDEAFNFIIQQAANYQLNIISQQTPLKQEGKFFLFSKCSLI